MIKFRKDFNVKIISVLIAGFFLLNSTVYAIDLSKKGHLRTRLMSNSEKGKKRLDDGAVVMFNVGGEEAKFLAPESDIPNDQLLNELEAYAEKVKQFAVSYGGKLPINELVLYIRVLIGMYKETIERYNKGVDYQQVHQYKAEFAGELAHHTRFLKNALKMLGESYKGAFRLLAEQYRGDSFSLSSLEKMMYVVDQIIKELVVYPEYRDMAINLINIPATYGLDEKDYLRKVRKEGEFISLDNVIAPTTITTSEDFAVVSDRLIDAARKKGEKESNLTNALKPTVEEVIHERISRLLVLANASANDDPELAEATMREYLRLLKKFGNEVNFYCDVTLYLYEDIMTSQPLRPVLLEIAENISRDGDKRDTLTIIARQMIREGDIDSALQLLEDVGYSNYRSYSVLEELIDILYPSTYVVSDAKSKKSLVSFNINRIPRLEKIIENISVHDRSPRDSSIALLVKIGDKYYQIGNTKKGKEFYKTAWDVSGRTADPVLTRLKYMIPLMREKDIGFPKSRIDVLEDTRSIAETELQKDYPNENPDPMILVAREHALSREYDEAEKCAKFIRDNMRFPEDHFDYCYGAIIEGAALYGDYEKASYAASKMTKYIKDHFERAAMMLVKRGRYQEAMELGDYAMAKGYKGSPTVGYWGSTQLRMAECILERDASQIETIRKYLEKSIEATGIDSFDLKDILKLFSKYPDLDPDGKFVLKIYETGFEKNRSSVEHDSHRIILQGLREIILAKAKKLGPSFVRMRDVYSGVDKDLEINGSKLLPSPIGSEIKERHKTHRKSSL